MLVQQIKNWDRIGKVMLIRIDRRHRQIKILCPKQLVPRLEKLCIKNTYCIKYRAHLGSRVIRFAKHFEQQGRLSIIKIDRQKRKICFCTDDISLFKHLLEVACPPEEKPVCPPQDIEPEPEPEAPISLIDAEDPGIWIVGRSTESDYKITCELIRLSRQERLGFRVEVTEMGSNRYWIYSKEEHLVDWLRQVNQTAACASDYTIECTDEQTRLVEAMLKNYLSKHDIKSWSQLSNKLFTFYGAGYVKTEIEQKLDQK